MPPPLVSIVTPSYHQGRFLRRTIESVLAQSYPHIEYLVCDGGSTDDSPAILRSYGDRFFWLSERDRGQAHAINKGLARARGVILAYLNSDDVLKPDAVARVVEHFQKHPDWDVLYGEAEYTDEEDRVIGRYPTRAFSLGRLRQYCFLCQPATFWRARTARRVGPFNESLHCCLDYEYWLRVVRAGGRFGQAPDVLACSRLYGDTKTLSLREKVYRESIRVLQEQVGFVEFAPVYGLWRHWCWEQKAGWPGRLRWLPGLCVAAALAHFVWLNRRRPWPWQLGSGLWRGLRRAWEPRQSPVLPG